MFYYVNIACYHLLIVMVDRDQSDGSDCATSLAPLNILKNQFSIKKIDF